MKSTERVLNVHGFDIAARDATSGDSYVPLTAASFDIVLT